MRRCIFLLVSVLLLIAGCAGKKKVLTPEELAKIPLAQREGLPECSGGFVLAVGDETITSDEVIIPLIEHFRPIAQRSGFERFKEQAQPILEQTLTTKISNILLYQQARGNAGEDVDEAVEKAVDAEVRRFVVGFEGDYAKAEQALKRMGMDWQSFKEYQKKMILRQDYIRRQLPEHKPVTYSELVNCYNELREEFFAIPAMLKFRLIDIDLRKLRVTDPNQTQQQFARELANELIGRLQAGEDFGALAKAYSHGHRREFGGLWKQVQPESLAEPYDVLAAEAEKIEPGQIAGPIEATGHIFIMRLEEKRPKSFQPFEKVQGQVEARIILDRRKQAFDELGAKLAQQVALGERSKFIDFCLEKIYQMSNQ